jgi:hypothetical protein
MEKARILSDGAWGGNYSNEWLENNKDIVFAGQLVSEWELTELLPQVSMKLPFLEDGVWVEHYIEIVEVPKEISRMKFKIQIRRSTIYSYDIILTYLQNLSVNEQFTQDDKDDLIDRLEDAVSFNRYHPDFINLANMLGVSDEKKDEIFINGNLLN